MCVCVCVCVCEAERKTRRGVVPKIGVPLLRPVMRACEKRARVRGWGVWDAWGLGC